jgi:hypothetical protein
MSKLVPMVMDIKQKVAPRKRVRLHLWEKICDAIFVPKKITTAEWLKGMRNLKQE